MVAKALTIAGSDSGGGAGIQADLKAFSAMGVYGASVVTAVTAQNTQAVTAIHPVPDDVVVAQIRAVLDDIEIDAIKIGMLGTPSLIAAVADARNISKRLKTAPTTPEVGYGVALFGTAILAGTPYAELHAMREAARGDGSGGYAADDSDSSDGSGSSDSGCGGGCGGCGG